MCIFDGELLWMWGINGAAGELAAVAAVAESMWNGISTSLYTRPVRRRSAEDPRAAAVTA